MGHPEVLPAEALWLTGPHTFVRRNRSFSEVNNLATGLLINHLSKEEIPVISRKNRHALLTCGSEVTQPFIPYKMSTELCVVFQEIQVVLA